MAIGTTLFIVAILIGLVWILIEMKRFRHKIFAVFLVVLILFSYFSFTLVLKDKGVNLKTVPGIIEGGKIYFSWLGSLFGNFKSITANAIKMDWSGGNKTKEG